MELESTCSCWKTLTMWCKSSSQGPDVVLAVFKKDGVDQLGWPD